MKLAITTAILLALPALAHADYSDGDRSDRYYKRTRGVGVFHQSRLVVGAIAGEAPAFMDGAPVMGETRDATQLSLGFEATFLGLPSSYGHFHGMELSTGVRTGPWDFWFQTGTALTLFNLGRGGPLSVRVGGGFGAGFDLGHGYGYVRGRAAIVLVPEKIDAEASVTWTPSSASTGDYDQRSARVSVWVRPGKSGRAYEGYVEAFHRLADGVDKEREVDGLGGGVGLSFF